MNVESVVLDSEGLSAWIRRDREVMAMLREFYTEGADLVICANTILEVTQAKVDKARLDWLLSQVRTDPVTKQSAVAAAGMLTDAGLHGHRHAIDATVAEVALRQPSPVVMLTSDVGDMRRLCGDRVRLIEL